MLLLLASLALAQGAAAIDDHVLLCEAVVTPTASEFIELVNPTGAPVALDNYYLSDDEDYALLPGAFGAGPAPSIASSDFIAQFPAGAVIPAGGVVVVAFDGAGFSAAFGFNADFEIFGTDAGTPDMIATDVGASAGLTNSGENAVLFFWDGASDLVVDVDMVNIGTPSSTNDIADKTGVSVDGPDGDAVASSYGTDAFTMPQQAGDPGFGASTHRIAFETGNEIAGSNGLTGDDETSEQITTTWDAPPFSAPDPGACSLVPSLPVVVINEIMQNPSAVGDSAGEWLELYNPTGSAIDIDGWTLADNDFDSHVIANGGPLLIPAGGYLVLGNNDDSGTNGGVTVAYEYSGYFLANGSDEVVLFDTALNEIDRVEYDDGATFPDPNGASMALIDPSLDNNDGANWCESSTAFGAGDSGTPGAANDCVVVVAEVVINEIMQNPSAVSDGDGEWLELYNPTGSAIDIDGWTLADNDFDSHVIANGGPLLIPAGGYLVLGNNSDFATNGGVNVDYEYSGVALANGSDEVVLFDTLMNEIDRVEYDNGATFPDPNGASMALALTLLDNNVGANWCESSTAFGSGDFGTPGADNDCTSIGFPLVINEIDYDQPGGDTAEFVEIKNIGGSELDLDPFSLVLVNGNGGAIYQTVDLPNVLLAAGDYYVVCSDATTVANCDLAVISSIQNGAPDAVALTLGALVVDTVSYEGDTIAPYTEGSGVGLEDSGADDFVGISRFADGVDSDQNNVDLSPACITPGRANSSLATGCTAKGPALEIFEIQGNGATTPFLGETVSTLSNVVTAVGPDGFAIQTPSARSDGDGDTSDGVFVFTGAAPTVAVGDLVDVTALASEFFDLTELTAFPDVDIIGSAALPAAVIFDENRPSRDPSSPSCAIEFECYEGMLVEIVTGVVTGPNQRFSSDIIAEVHIVAGADRAFREPGIEFPGLVGLPVWDGNPEVFELDPNRLGLTNTIIPAGSTFSATGIIGFEFGGYELWPTSVTVNEAVLPSPVRAKTADELTVGSLNVFRLFDDINDGGEQVVNAVDYARRLEKFSAYIRDVLRSPDILAIQEVEKLGVLDDLAAQIAFDDPAVLYTAYLVEGNDVGGIDVGFLVRDSIAVDAVTQLAAGEINTFDGSLLHDRPPLLLEAHCVEGGAISVIVVHNRSLGGIDDPVDGPRVRSKRLDQAQSIATIVQNLQTADPDIHLVVIGDFNAYEFTDGYVDAVGQIMGDFVPADNLLSGPDLVNPDLADQVLSLTPDERYSFIFRGSAQVLDHALTSQALDPFLRGMEYGRGNADAAFDLLNDGTTPLRSSDHDGLVLYLAKDRDEDGVPDDLDVCLGTEIPESLPTRWLGINRYALVDGDTVFDTHIPPGGGPGDVFTTDDTGGCSCEQIIDALGLGMGHSKFGCSVGVMRDWVDAVNP